MGSLCKCALFRLENFEICKKDLAKRSMGCRKWLGVRPNSNPQSNLLGFRGQEGVFFLRLHFLLWSAVVAPGPFLQGLCTGAKGARHPAPFKPPSGPATSSPLGCPPRRSPDLGTRELGLPITHAMPMPLLYLYVTSAFVKKTFWGGYSQRGGGHFLCRK